MYPNMRGDQQRQACAFSYLTLEQRVPADHRLRPVRCMVNEALEKLSLHFDALYSRRGRPSIAPEHLLRALLLQIFYGIRSEAQLMEYLRYNLLFRWFVGLEMDEEVWDATVFTKNRDRLMQGEISQRFLQAVVEKARAANLLSAEHFTVDGTLLEAWANRRSFQAKDPATVKGTGSKGQKLLRDTHESTTDPQARLYKKSTAGEVKPSYLGHTIIENRHGLIVTACATQSSTAAERAAALDMLQTMGFKLPLDPKQAPWKEIIAKATLGGDKQYQDPTFISRLRQMGIIPHIAEYDPGHHEGKNSLLPQERESAGFVISQKKRKLVEMVFGWGKLSSIMRKMKLHGLKRVDWLFRLMAAAHNLVRMVKLIPAQ